MKFGQLILRKIVAARPVGSTPGGWSIPKVPATGSWSNPESETVGPIMGEVRARCIEALYLQQLPPRREVHLSDKNDCNERIIDNLICSCELPRNKAIKKNSRNYSVCKSFFLSRHTISA